jgi:methionyl-tRNA formyltransferase
MTRYRCIFLGYLEPLLEALYCIQAVDLVSVGIEPSRPQAKMVGRFCAARGINCFDASRIRSNNAFEKLLTEGIDIVVVGAFGQILNKEILSRPKHGMLNFHSSLLPAYRGGSPIEEQIIRGDDVGGVTLHWMAEGVDAGPIVVNGSFEIGANDDYRVVLDKAVQLGSELITELFKRPIEEWPKKDQPSDAPIYPARKKEDGLIDWSMDATTIDRIVRAFGWREWSRVPLADGDIVLQKATVVGVDNPSEPGTVLAIAPKTIISCGKYAIELIEARMPRALIVGEVLKPGSAA